MSNTNVAAATVAMTSNTARVPGFNLLISAVMLILGNGDLLQGLERKAYDMGVAATSRTPSDKVAVIAIDKQSLDNIGRWPWSREIMADMVDKLAAAKAKVIAKIEMPEALKNLLDHAALEQAVARRGQ